MTTLALAATGAADMAAASASTTSPANAVATRSGDSSTGATSRPQAARPAVAASPSALSTQKSRFFHSTSHWYTPLPSNAPLDPWSAVISKNLLAQAREAFVFGNGKPGLALNTTKFSPTFYVSGARDKVTPVTFRNCFGGKHVPAPLVKQMAKVRIPAKARPALGSDHEMSVYDPKTDTIYEFWRIDKAPNGTWRACWGGAIPKASTSNGTFTAPYGAAASGLSFFGGTIRYDELVKGEINHVIGIAIPETNPKWVSWPANRTDGRNPSGRHTLSQGQLLRLPANLNLKKLKLNKIEMAVARAAQKYGMRVWDTAGAVSMRAENPLSWGGSSKDYYTMFQKAKLPQYKHLDVFANFPLEKLQAVRSSYRAPGSR